MQSRKEGSIANSQENGETVRMKGYVQLSQKTGLRNCGKACARVRRRTKTVNTAWDQLAVGFPRSGGWALFLML